MRFHAKFRCMVLRKVRSHTKFHFKVFREFSNNISIYINSISCEIRIDQF